MRVMGNLPDNSNISAFIIIFFLLSFTNRLFYACFYLLEDFH